jgi:hypothetical protein
MKTQLRPRTCFWKSAWAYLHIRWGIPLLLALLAPGIVPAQQLIYQEGFNDDGEKANPPRYTTIGRGVYELDRQASELNLTTQAGAVYWAHNFEVKSYVGIPAPTAGRRAMLAWDLTIAPTEATDNFFRLFDATVKWLVNNKAAAAIAISPNMAAAQTLADHLTSVGYAVTDDDETVGETNIVADFIIKCTGNTNPSRWANSAKPVMIISSADDDDMQTSTIGTAASFEAGVATILATNHPAAGGLTGSFAVATGTHTAWQLMGDNLPGGEITLAYLYRTNAPSAASLAEVDAMVAGTTVATQATAQVDALDFSDGSAGDWPTDNPIPGGATGVFGLVCTGKINVAKAGTYSFALGMDDGARLRIDLDKNGFSNGDNVIVADASGSHRAVYGDATFASPGTYDFEVTMFNSGGGGDLEMSVSTTTGGGDTNVITGGTWELLGQTTGSVTLQGQIKAVSYVPTQPTVLVVPFIVLLNGPQDTPPGSVYGGGPISGQEGTGFFAGAGINKWPYPTNAPTYSLATDPARTLRLRPVDVTGKKNVKIVIALAASFQDFETDDYLLLMADPDGDGPLDPQILAVFSAPDANTKYFVDTKNGNINRLGLKFIDCTYNVPDGATQLAVEIRAKTTWWNEIVAFDNIRIIAGESAPPPLIQLSASLAGANLNLSWTGGTPPFVLQTKANLQQTNWLDLLTTSDRTYSAPTTNTAQFFRLKQ